MSRVAAPAAERSVQGRVVVEEVVMEVVMEVSSREAEPSLGAAEPAQPAPARQAAATTTAARGPCGPAAHHRMGSSSGVRADLSTVADPDGRGIGETA
jgi:hypothetical protein